MHPPNGRVHRRAYKRYEKSAAKTGYIEFEGRPHLHMAAPDWEEVAEGIEAWLGGVLDMPIADGAKLSAT